MVENALPEKVLAGAEKARGLRAVMLPDFFLDHFIKIDEPSKFFGELDRVRRAGGGNVPGFKQHILHGGNACNTATLLSKLGLAPYLICRTSPEGLGLLRAYIPNGNLEHVKTDGRMAMTLALELIPEHVNIMVNYAEPIAFGFEDLNEQDRDLIKTADLVCVVNWSLNKKGTDLARGVLGLASGQTFMDTSDPSFRKQDIPEMISILETSKPGMLSLNDSEALWYASHYSPRIRERKGERGIAIEAARIISEHIKSKIFLHTKWYSLLVQSGAAGEKIPSFNTRGIQFTGAGDSWNGGMLAGKLFGLSDEEAILFANGVAGFYVTYAKHPTLEEALEFIRTKKQLKLE